MERLLKSKYKTRGKIGENPFSLTYKGITLDNKTQVVIKIYKRGTLNSNLIKSMKQKVKIFSQIEHPNIARFLDGDYGWQGFYYVREFISGISLRELLKTRKSFDVEDVRKIGETLSNALGAAHKFNIVHGAINLNNIIIRNDNLPVLTDFVIEGDVKEAQPQKTLYIMEHADSISPEEIQGGPAQKSSDLYSLGFALYCLLTKLDISPIHSINLSLKKMRGEFPPISGVAKYMNDILIKAMSPDPLLRFSNINQMEDSFKNKSLVGQKADFVSAPRIEIQDKPEEKREPQEVIVIKKERKRSFFLLIIVILAILAGLIYSFVNSYFMSFR